MQVLILVPITLVLVPIALAMTGVRRDAGGERRPNGPTDGGAPRGQGSQGGSNGPRSNANRGPRGNGMSGGRNSRDAGRGRGRSGGGQGQGAPAKKMPDYLPAPVAPNVVRIVPLGGVEEVGRNMVAVEVGDDIFVFDVGFQFVSEESAPGVDYILPNTKYLEVNAHRVRAAIITHGHLDHIGGIPFLMSRFGNPPIYTQNLTAVMIAKRQEEYPDVPKPEIIVVETGTTRTIGSTKVKFFPVTHSIPDSMGNLT